ncbi:hypothetical protein I309_04266 [Cryptococcus deuterogattii LA55]|nr:hypothetical protein I309_04266 [Cryptococcus deuterogattii LA55]KIR94371.1 hypothetical protein I304_02013 [Cryptococcus deuterogattii CBS 10090]
MSSSFPSGGICRSLEQKLLSIAYACVGIITERDSTHRSLAKIRTIYEGIPQGYIVTSISHDPFGCFGLSIHVAVRLPVYATVSYKDVKDCYVLEQTLIRIAWNAAFSKLENGKSPGKAVRNARKVLARAIKSIQGIIGMAAYFRFAHVHYSKVPTYWAVVYSLKKPPVAERWAGELEKRRVEFMKSLECTLGALARDQWTTEQKNISSKIDCLP